MDTTSPRKSRLFLKALKSPWMVLLGLTGGIFLGMLHPGLSFKLAAFGDLYLKFLTMCVIPIMVSAVISSFGRLLASRESAAYLKRIMLVFSGGMMLAAAIGLGTALIANPGEGLSPDTRAMIGKVLMQAESTTPSGASGVLPAGQGLHGFMEMLIPANIFGALSAGKNLQILFFSLVFGFAIGMIPSSGRDHFLDLTEVVFKSFEQIINMAMYLLPAGLLCMIAGQVAGAGIGILLAMSRFVVIIHIAIVVLLILAGVAVSIASKKSFFRSFSDLREPIIIAFATRSSYATMPSILDAMRKDFNIRQDIANLIVPLSVVICRYSMIMIFTIGSVFMAELYGMPIGLPQAAAIFGGSILASLAGAGAPGIISLSMISMVLIPLGLPAEAAIILMLAVNFIIDPALTILNVYLSCAAAVVIGRNSMIEDVQPHPCPVLAMARERNSQQVT